MSCVIYSTQSNTEGSKTVFVFKIIYNDLNMMMSIFCLGSVSFYSATWRHTIWGISYIMYPMNPDSPQTQIPLLDEL